MKDKDPELQRLSAEMDAAQAEMDSLRSTIDSIKSKRNSIKSQIEAVNYRIQDLKSRIDNEYSAMRLCYQRKDRIDGDNHKYNAESLKGSLNAEYSYKNNYRSQLDSTRYEYDSVMSRFNAAKDRKTRAREAFQSKLQQLKAKWHEKPCAKCGATIRYHEDWEHIPSICKNCKSKK